MKKQDIKKLLREGLFQVEEAEQQGGEQKPKEKERNTKKDYADIRHAIKKQLAPTQVGLMKSALGWEDDEDGTNRSLFGKMLHQETNDEGSIYQFNDEQIARVRTALDLS
jgi:hypothetical protein